MVSHGLNTNCCFNNYCDASISYNSVQRNVFTVATVAIHYRYSRLSRILFT